MVPIRCNIQEIPESDLALNLVNTLVKGGSFKVFGLNFTTIEDLALCALYDGAFISY